MIERESQWGNWCWGYDDMNCMMEDPYWRAEAASGGPVVLYYIVCAMMFRVRGRCE